MAGGSGKLFDERRHGSPALGTPRPVAEASGGVGVTPWYVRRPSPQPVPRSPPTVAPSAAPAPAHILIVEDDLDARAFLEVALRGPGYVVTAVSDGASALRELRAAPPNVLLLDLGLPLLDGYEVLRQLRTFASSLEVPVVVMSGRGDHTDVARALSEGANDYITKPVDLDVLHARIRVQLEAHRAHTRLQRINRLQDDFLRVASHDIRNPLTAVLLNIRSLASGRAGALTPEQAAMLARAARSSEFCLHLLENLLEMVRLEAAPLGLVMTEAHAGAVLGEVVERHAAEAAAKHIRISTMISDGLPPVTADPLRLQQALGNLLSNALKFSHRNSEVRVLAFHDGDAVAFEVMDQGQGIPAEEQSLLFHPFQKLTVRPTGSEPTAGLGLAITRRIVELHRGELLLHSQVGVGTTVRVRIPATPGKSA
ncbi:MAG: HAMP domain-containing sensor histidine kinase [Myxococcota bacterium]